MKQRSFPADLPDAPVTPPGVFFGRRAFLRAAAATGFAGAVGGCGVSTASVQDGAEPDPRIVPPRDRPESWPDAFAGPSEYALPAGIDKDVTPRLDAASHNNFYEFLPGRGGDVWPKTRAFDVEPWELTVGGACDRPAKLSLSDIDAFPHEQRLYHFRCVERWAMNIPWVGFPLRALLERVRPTAKATHVRFVSALRPEQMPGIGAAGNAYPWPYQEGLRLDEAMNELAFVVTGVYGDPLPKQHGAPIRIIVPWKYGYKSPKSLVGVELVEAEPATLWSTAQPHEYGFVSNVNPNIPHPRWSQARSYWLHDQQEWFATPIFNGYERYVADLYPDEPREPQEPLRPGQTAR